MKGMVQALAIVLGLVLLGDALVFANSLGYKAGYHEGIGVPCVQFAPSYNDTVRDDRSRI